MRIQITPLAALLLLVVGCAAPQASREGPTSGVVIVGDGRSAADPSVPGSAGWGDALAAMLRPGTAVTNLARPDGSLSRFLAEDGLNRALAARPRFLIIGFGQGDAEAKTAPGLFTTNLIHLVEAARTRGAMPLLVTPPVLRTFDPVTGKPARGAALPADARVYADAVTTVARATGVELLDLRAEMRKPYQEIGDRANAFLHPPLDMSKEPASNVREHKKWRTPTARHPSYFSATGADSLAHWLANLMRAARSPMSALLRPVDGPPSPGYRLVWSDEFDGAQWNTNSWSCRSPGPRKEGVNDPACLRLDGQGHLVIDVKKVGDKFHSGMISTAGKRAWTHGYFECRMTLVREPGYWNAFWFMADTVGAPQKNPALADQTRRNGVEIDVVEYLKTQGDVLHMNLHWNGYGDLHRSSPFDAFVPDFRRQEWHVFGVDWRTDGYTFYVDGRRAWETGDAPSDTPEYIILSVEIGKWAGDISKAKLPQQVKVDWVRVWQQGAP